MRWLLGLVAVIVATAGITAAAVKQLDLAKDDTSVTEAVTSTTGPSLVLPPGQSKVTGTITSLSATGARVGPLAMPMTVTTPERGAGAGATFEGAVVDGELATIVWDAGRPLELDGEGGALVVGPVAVNADASGVVIGLDGPVHGLAPAAYHIATPVAVGTSGLGKPVSSVSFDADDGTSVQFSGNASVALAVQPYTLLGPGGVTLTGALKVETAEGVVDAASITLARGPFEVAITPDPATGGYTVVATLQGATTTA